MMRQENAVYRGAEGRESVFDLGIGETDEWLVLFVHGYKGYKDWGAWHLVMDAFRSNGIGFCKFNLSHNGGTVSDPIDFPDLDAFGRNSYWKEFCDIGLMLDHLAALGVLEGRKVALVGHSRGGGDAILRAAVDPRIEKLVTWAGVSDFFARFPSGEAFENWKREGVMHVVNGRTKQDMPHFYDPFYTETIAHRQELDIENAARSLQMPWLIVHGENDEAVALREAELLKEFNSRAELVVIPEAGHTFGSKHPWEGEELPSDLKVVVERTIEFVKR